MSQGVIQRVIGVLAGAICFTTLGGTAHAAPIVTAGVTPLGGGVFHYDVTIFNNTLVDLAIVSILNAPMGDPLIAPSLASPPGFLASYDSGLGIVDFLEGSASFAAGLTVSGFSFDSQSQATPGLFSVFSALTVNGEPLEGSVDIVGGVAVPEPGTVGLLGAGLALLGALWARKVRNSSGRARVARGKPAAVRSRNLSQSRELS